MLEDLDSVRAYPVKTKNDVYEGATLTKKYCLYPPRPKDIVDLMEADRWSYGEILSDVIKNPKIRNDAGRRETVGFIMFMDGEKKEVGNVLMVRFFAMQPWYDTDTIVKWVKYRITKLLDAKLDLVSVYWPVDEYNLALQECLKENGFIAVNVINFIADSFSRNGQKEMISKILFALDE